MVLQSIRERLTGILAFFILGILVIPFAFVGVNSYFTSSTDNIVARVNDAEITANDFNQSYSNYRRRMQSIMGAAFDPVAFDTLIARREHLDALIDEELMNQAARSIDLEVDDDRLAEQIRRIPAFQVDGVFNVDVYQSRLLAQGLSPKQFEQEMRTREIMNQLPSGIFSSSITTQSELEEFIGLQEQTRQFKAVLVPAQVEEVTVEATAEEIQAYYDENMAAYQSEEMVVIEYLELNALDIPTGTEPDEDFLRSRFEQQEGRFVSPEQRLASHILIEVSPDADDATKETARQQAEDLSGRAKDGEDFAELAREYSQDAGSAALGGDLGWIEPGFMSEAFETALYELSMDNPVSDPVQTGFGWHVIQLREIQASTGMSFEEAREILITEHQAEESEREFLDQADRLVDLIYEDPTTLESAALDLGLDVKQAGPFSRAGGEGIAANPDVVSAAFSDLVLLQASVSDPVDLGENHIVMIRLNEHLPAAARPLEEVSEQITETLKQQRAQDLAKSKAEELLAALDDEGATIESLAEAAGLETVVSDAAKRRDFTPDPVTVREVFRLAGPTGEEPVRAVVDSSNGFALVILESVTAGSMPENMAQGTQQFRRQIANAAASAESLGVLRQLRDSATVEVFEDRLR
jgi:peptidyl-prolyl cis-trans isomerase D